MDEPNEQRTFEIEIAASGGPLSFETSPVRKGDVQQVELTRVGPDWVCGTITMSSPLGKLAGAFAARVR